MLTPSSSPGGGGGVWEEHVDPKTSRTYYYNPLTGESSWTKPGAESADDAAGDAAAVATWDANEALTFTLFANETLAAHPVTDNDALQAAVAGRLPISSDADPPALFSAACDGVLLSRLASIVAPDSLDTRAIDVSGGATAAADNCQLAVSSAQAAGAVFGKDVTAANLQAGAPLSVCDFLWQVMRLQVLGQITMRGADATLVQLAKEGETAAQLLSLDATDILLRWLNHTLHGAAAAAAFDAGTEGLPQVTALGPPLVDGIVLAALVHVLAPEMCESVPASRAAVAAAGADATVTAVLSAAFGVGVPPWFSVEGITSGNRRLQTAFLAYLFQHRNGLQTPDAKAGAASGAASGAGVGAGAKKAGPTSVSAAMAALTAELAASAGAGGGSGSGSGGGVSREALTVAQWINSYDIEGVYVRGESIASDLKDGTVLLQLLDAVEPGIVAWQRVNGHPGSNRYKQVENSNYVINLGKAMDFHLVNVAGLDIVDGNNKLILAFLWQLMRYATLKQLSRLAFDGFAADEHEILRWANERVKAAVVATGQDASSVGVNTFHDAEWASGIFLLYLLNDLRPGVVNWDLVADGESLDQRVANARYVLSLARRIGVQVYCSHHDIVECVAKPIMLLVASMMVAESQRRSKAATEAGAGAGAGAAAADDVVGEAVRHHHADSVSSHGDVAAAGGTSARRGIGAARTKTWAAAAGGAGAADDDDDDDDPWEREADAVDDDDDD